MKLVPVSLRQARAFVDLHHRHSEPQFGWKFGVGLDHDGELVGIAMAGQPVSRHLDDGTTIEVTRLVTVGHDNACSMLYGAICRAAKALGYRRVLTYTLETESGISPKAAGFQLDGLTDGNRVNWSSPSRPRIDDNLFGSRRPPAGSKRRWVRLL